MAFGDDATPLDVLGIGNAIVDVLSPTDDATLERHALPKGAMTLIDADRAEALYGQMGPGVEVSGGSCANTMAGIASLGGRSAYIGRVRDDELGRIFTHDIRAAGVDYGTPPAADGPRHGALPDHGHARRPAHHVHLPRRERGAGARGHRRGPGGERGRHVPRGLPVGPAAGQGGLPHRDGRRPRRRAPGRRSRSRTRSASSATARSSSRWSTARWTSCSPTRTRSRPSTRWATPRPPSPRCAAAARSP